MSSPISEPGLIPDIYKTIDLLMAFSLQENIKKTRTTDFVRFLMVSPKIAQYVHTLYYNVSFTNCNVKGLDGELRLFTKLHTFRVALIVDMKWQEVPLTLREAIMHLCHIPTRLEASSLDMFILPDITKCIHVKELSIADSRCGAVEPDVQRDTLHLEKFSLLVEDNFSRIICSPRPTLTGQISWIQ